MGALRNATSGVSALTCKSLQSLLTPQQPRPSCQAPAVHMFQWTAKVRSCRRPHVLGILQRFRAVLTLSGRVTRNRF